MASCARLLTAQCAAITKRRAGFQPVDPLKLTHYLVLSTVVASLAWCADDAVEAGKKVFVERCSSCHAERGDKPLSTGLPLNERSLTDAQLNRAVAGRLKSSPPEEKRAVALYIRSLLKK